jgi:hypothetical protein
MPPRTLTLSAAGCALLLLAGEATRTLAQQPAATPPAPTFPNVRVTGRLQSQGYWFDNDRIAPLTGPESNFFLRRARIEARGSITENISFVISPSFEGGRVIDVARGRAGVRLRDAFLDVRLTPAGAPTAFSVRMGQEKKPFGRYELISSSNLPTIERGGGRGLLARTTNDLFEENGFLAHDIGASAVLTAAHERLTFRAGVYNGQGESANDRNDAKSFGARATYTVWRKLNVGGSAFSRDVIMVPGDTSLRPDSSFRSNAFGVDAGWGAPGEPGLFTAVDVMSGQEAAEGHDGIRGLNAVAAWHVRTGHPGLLWAWEPVVRVDRSDPNADVDDNHQMLLDAGVGLYFSSRAHFRVMLERQSFGDAVAADPIVGVRTQLGVTW